MCQEYDFTEMSAEEIYTEGMYNLCDENGNFMDFGDLMDFNKGMPSLRCRDIHKGVAFLQKAIAMGHAGAKAALADLEEYFTSNNEESD